VDETRMCAMLSHMAKIKEGNWDFGLSFLKLHNIFHLLNLLGPFY
jgi:hypothetical protein